MGSLERKKKWLILEPNDEGNLLSNIRLKPMKQQGKNEEF